MKSDPGELATHLESTVWTFVHAINTRNLHPTSSPWTSMAPGFLADPDGFTEPESVPLAGYLTWLEENIAKAPGYCIEVLGMNTYFRGNGCADVYVEFELGGVGEGVRSRHVSVLEFERWRGEGEGEWTCVRLWGIRGQRGLDGL